MWKVKKVAKKVQEKGSRAVRCRWNLPMPVKKEGNKKDYKGQQFPARLFATCVIHLCDSFPAKVKRPESGPFDMFNFSSIYGPARLMNRANATEGFFAKSSLRPRRKTNFFYYSQRSLLANTFSRFYACSERHHLQLL